jgi:hypothetical protein
MHQSQLNSISIVTEVMGVERERERERERADSTAYYLSAWLHSSTISTRADIPAARKQNTASVILCMHTVPAKARQKRVRQRQRFRFLPVRMREGALLLLLLLLPG